MKNYNKIVPDTTRFVEYNWRKILRWYERDKKDISAR